MARAVVLLLMLAAIVCAAGPCFAESAQDENGEQEDTEQDATDEEPPDIVPDERDPHWWRTRRFKYPPLLFDGFYEWRVRRAQWHVADAWLRMPISTFYREESMQDTRLDPSPYHIGIRARFEHAQRLPSNPTRFRILGTMTMGMDAVTPGTWGGGTIGREKFPFSRAMLFSFRVTAGLGYFQASDLDKSPPSMHRGLRAEGSIALGVLIFELEVGGGLDMEVTRGKHQGQFWFVATIARPLLPVGLRVGLIEDTTRRDRGGGRSFLLGLSIHI
jgi:hypothetical protein